MRKLRLFFVLALMLQAGVLSAQNTWALKTNLLHDATLSVNLAGEYAFAPQWSAEMSASVNAWRSWGGSRLQHFLLQPEIKYWTCERYTGWFLCGNLLGGVATLGNFWDLSQYNPKSPDLRNFLLKDALVLGIGVGGGYDFILSRHWNLEVEGSVGYMYSRGDEYDDVTPPELLLKGSEFDYIGLTKLAVSIVYLF